MQKNYFPGKYKNNQDGGRKDPNTQDLFHGAKVAKLVSYQRLEFNIYFIHQGVYFCMHKDTFDM